MSVLFLLIFSLSLVMGIPPAKAQTADDQVPSDYTYRFSQFRTIYDEYQLKKTQYTTNPTFAHEEELIVAAKNMLNARDQLWWTYWQAIRTQLSQSPGMDEAVKQPLLEKIMLIQTSLETHQKTLEPLNTRKDLLPEALVINEKSGEYRQLSYLSLAALRRAQLIYSIRELKDFTGQLSEATAIQIRDTTLRQARLRGLEEVMSILDTQAAALGDQSAEAAQFEKAYRVEKAYETAVTKFTSAYGGIQQVYSRLKELSRDIEL